MKIKLLKTEQNDLSKLSNWTIDKVQALCKKYKFTKRDTVILNNVQLPAWRLLAISQNKNCSETFNKWCINPDSINHNNTTTSDRELYYLITPLLNLIKKSNEKVFYKSKRVFVPAKFF
jgi:hypothetical protein